MAKEDEDENKNSDNDTLVAELKEKIRLAPIGLLSEKELEENPRARSSKLRTIEKIL